MHKIIVRLPADRDYTGLLEIEGPGRKRIAGPFAVCGRADDQGARDKGNPRRNPLLAAGDTPLGEFQAVKIVESGPGTPYDGAEYGSAGIVLLEPRRGDAALADANGRFVFLIHGGATARHGALRPTDGSLRLSNRDQRALIGVLRRIGDAPCHCVPLKAGDAGGKVAVAKASPRGDRPSSAGEISNLSRRLWLRNMALATGVSVVVPSVLVFSLQSAFGATADADYPNPAPPAPPEPSPPPDPDDKNLLAQNNVPLQPFPQENPNVTLAGPGQPPGPGADKTAADNLNSANGHIPDINSPDLDHAKDGSNQTFDTQNHVPGGNGPAVSVPPSVSTQTAPGGSGGGGAGQGGGGSGATPSAPATPGTPTDAQTISDQQNKIPAVQKPKGFRTSAPPPPSPATPAAPPANNNQPAPTRKLPGLGGAPGGDVTT